MHMSELESRIRQRAYAIWEQSGRPEGCERQHWEQAAREVLTSARTSEGTEPKATKGRIPAKSAGAKSRTRKAAERQLVSTTEKAASAAFSYPTLAELWAGQRMRRRIGGAPTSFSSRTASSMAFMYWAMAKLRILGGPSETKVHFRVRNQHDHLPSDETFH
jgi:hypothetical protein